ncbi:MAG TPA: sterol desaturase family protein [Acetobacteraceae bacterium]|nr:sterol desaturase family protein [Acetobacteraceae bacterium]
MDDGLHGRRDHRGNWRPFAPIAYPPVFVWPVRPLGILKWLPGYYLSWNALYALIAVLVWLFLTPPLDAIGRLDPATIVFIFARNVVLTLVFFGAWHLRLYIQKAQGTAFKFNVKWPERDKRIFLFGSQTAENLFWTFASGLPIWTAYEVLTLYAFANGWIPYLSFQDHPWWFVVVMLAVPLFREIHFYAVHRLIHWPPLYRAVHKLHHKNVNPSPWSGLAMHPGEHLLYFSAVLIHWVVPSHPVHALFNLIHLGLAPAPGHAGFDKVVLGESRAIDTHCYAHYLHHKHFRCNYADGAIPLDKWFGSFHDGSDAAHEAMSIRLRTKSTGAREAQA